MTTLVTGASGFVGSAVVRRLLGAGHEVRVLVRARSNRSNLEGLPVEAVLGDLRDRQSLDLAVKGCHSLFHVAADYRLWTRRPQDLYDSNVDGSLNILRAAAAAGVGRIVYTSSVATMGLNPGGEPANEETPVALEDMIGHYKRSKFIAEQEVLKLANKERLPVVVVNPSTPMGPRDVKPTPTGRIIVQAAAGRMPAYVDTGLNVVHVDDVAEGHLCAYEKGEVGERYLLGGEDWTLQGILQQVASLADRSPPRVRLPHGVVMPMAYIAEAWAWITQAEKEPMICVDGVRMSKKLMFFSSDKARQQLDYNPRPALEALQDAVHWFKEHGYF